MSVFTNPAGRAPEHAAAYTNAVLGLLGERDPMEVLHGTTAALESALQGFSPSELTRPEAPDKWSIRHVLQHLADSELVWGFRMRLVLAHDRPIITGYDQDLWADRLGYDRVDARQALADFRLLRDANLRLLADRPESDLRRVGIHAERGEESVAHMMRMYAGHDLLHLRQIERIRSRVREGDRVGAG